MSADPFHPVSAGRHITDDGVRYAVSPGLDLAGADFFGGSEIDVYGCHFQAVGGWPSIVVELNFQAQLTALDDNDRLTFGEDLMPAILATRGFVPATGIMAPPPADPVQVTVRNRPRNPARSGVFTPGVTPQDPRWEIISPLPPWPAEFDRVVPQFGHRMAVYLTLHTGHLSGLHGDALALALMAEVAAGRLYGTTAAVV